MAIRYPLVLKDDNTIQEVPIGDTIFLFPSNLPVTLRTGTLLNVSIIDGKHVMLTRRDGTTVNILVQI